jgi:hypothetical protein
VGAIMCSYNQVNNSYACQNSYTINHILKGELDFQGFGKLTVRALFWGKQLLTSAVMSDWNAQHSGVAAALAGLDMSMPGDIGFSGSGYGYWGGNLTAAVINGTVPQWRLDDMVVRIMSAYYKVGRDTATIPINFDSWTQNTTSYLHQFSQTDLTQVNWHINVQDDHASVAREVAQRSNVLLKNTGQALPLSKPASMAVIGEDAHSNPGGPDACPDRGCDVGTLAMGWGSGTAQFPYLVAPVDALRAQAANDGTKFTNVSDNYDIAAAVAAAKDASVAIVFGNADSGEAYITIDGNAGDRSNLTLWGGADALIEAVADVNPNTIVVLHTTGPVIVEAYKNNPNIKAIIWAGLPGQESGNALVDVLYGKVNPTGKSVFTWGKDRADYGTDILYDSPDANPQIEFTEGVFIDYRHFDKYSIEPSYEFGYGLTYTTFEYSNLQITKKNPGPYQPTMGLTSAAPTFGTIDKNPKDNEFPAGFPVITPYVYPYLTTQDPLTGDGIVPPGSQDFSPQPKNPAGGSAGGNRQLYDVLYEVTADIKNTGTVDGVEVVQLVSSTNDSLLCVRKLLIALQYISLGGADDPKVVLRGFDDVSIDAGKTETFTYEITRRDISNWDPVTQNWVISSAPKTVYVGSSSRTLLLSQQLW